MLAALAAGMPLAAREAASVPPSTVTDVLARYENGEYDKATKQLQNVSEYGEDGLLFEFYRDSPKWMAAAGPEAAARRRMIVATAALEAASYHVYTARPFIEFACEMLRASSPESPALPPTKAERLWFLASTALLEYQDDWTFLNGAPLGPNGSFVGTWVPLETGSIQLGHLMHAEARLPGEPRFALARGIGIEYSARTVVDARRQTIIASDLLAAEMIDVNSRLTAARVAAVRRAIAVFEPLVSNAEVGAEARLRLGYCQLRLGQHAGAIASFEQAEARSTDAWVVHLSALFRGWTLDRDGRHVEAAAAYRSALAAVPRARTAVTLLTASLVENGHGAEAETVSTEFLSAKTLPEDPWLQYFQGDARQYDALLAQLREAIK
jgi:tetratricopeptide (TPR) repeat protein